MPQTPAPTLEAIGTAVPAHEVLQSEIRRRAAEFFGALPGVERYLTVYDHAGVDTRYFAQPVEWYDATHGWADRNRAFVEAALELTERAARSALERAGRDAEEVQSVVAVTTTGLATPSLDAHLAQSLGLRAGVQRVPVWGLGCAGGVAGLGIAADLARAHPDGVSLLVAVELCSLTFDRGDRSLRQLVATSLFGDGAAAAVIGPPSDGPRITGHDAFLFPNSFHVMGWDVLDEGLRVVLDPNLPEEVRHNLARAAAPILEATDPRTLRHAPHPGGPRVLEAYAAALGLDAASLEVSRRVLARFGNMSSPTALFVLEEALRGAGDARQPVLTSALGPGFSANFARIETGAPL